MSLPAETAFRSSFDEKDRKCRLLTNITWSRGIKGEKGRRPGPLKRGSRPFSES